MSKLAIITGSSGGIGQALVEKYIDDDYVVIGFDIKATKGLKTDSLKTISTDLYQFSVDEKYRRKIIKSAKNLYPKNINSFVLINNAAQQILNPVTKLSYKDWESSLTINLLAPFFMVQSFITDLKKYKGHVVNISSIHTKLTKQRFASYAASKAALDSLTKSLAIELSQFGICINSVAPAAISTKMLKASFKGKIHKFNKLKNYHPTNSIGSPEEIAEFVKLLTDSDIKFLTGSTINIDGAIGGLLFDPE